MKNRYWAVLGISLVLAIKGSIYLLWGREIFNTGVHVQHIPAQIRLGELAYVVGTIPAFFAEDLLTVQPAVEAFLIRNLGITYYQIFHFLSWAQLCMALVAVYWIGKTITQSAFGGLFCIAGLVWGWVHMLSVTYLIDFNIGMFPGMLGISVALLVLALWLKDRWVAALALAGVLFDIHISNAFIIAVIVAIDLVRQAISQSITASQMKRVCWGALLGLCLSTPQLILILKANPATLSSELLSQWWAWVEIRKPYHIFPWKHLYQIVQGSILVALVGMGLILSKRHQWLRPDIQRKTFAILLGVVGLSLVHWVGVEFFRSQIVAQLYPTRSTVFLVPVALAFLFLIGRHCLNFRSLPHLLFGLTILGINFMPMERPREWLLTFLLLSFLGVFFRKKTQTLSPAIYARARNVVVVSLGLVMITGAVLDFRVVKRMLNSFVTSNWRPIEDLKNWAAVNTRPEEVFLLPPAVTCGAICLERIPLIQGGDIGASVYILRGFAFEKEVLKSLFNVDVSDREQGKRLRLENTTYFSDAYEKLTTADVLRVSKEFPKVKYMVAFAENGKTLNFPVLYQNSLYLVYGLNEKKGS